MEYLKAVGDYRGFQRLGYEAEIIRILIEIEIEREKHDNSRTSSNAENTEDAALLAALRHIDSYIMQLERMYKERDALNIAMSMNKRGN